MKTLILAGGKGTRFMEETKRIPKPMIPINGKPMIFYIIDHYLKFDFVDFERYSGFVRKDPHHIKSMEHHNTSMNVFIKKWGLGMPGMHWGGGLREYSDKRFRTALEITPDVVVKSPQWIMYPFFECKIKNLKDKNYINYETED